MKKYTTIDKYIIGLLLLFILFELLFNTQFTIQYIGMILVGCYLIFIMSHIALCWPIIVVLIYVTEHLNLDMIPSTILQYLVRIILIATALIIMYLVIPVIITGLIRYNFDVVDNYHMYLKVLNGK